MSIIDLIEKNVEKNPTKIAIIDEERQIVYEKLFQEIQEFSKKISFLNKKEVISLVSENSISFIISYFGIINSGKIVHLLSPEITEINLLEQLDSADSEAIICPRSTIDRFLSINSGKIPIFEIEEIFSKQKNTPNHKLKNEMTYLIYTSGTTSKPKGVAVSHSMIEFTTRNIIDVLDYSDSDVDLVPLPLYHSFGLGCIHTSLFAGSTLVLLKNSMNLEKILETMNKFNVTTLAAVPATLTKLLKLNIKNFQDFFKDIRLIMTNSTTVPKKTVLEYKKILRKGNLATYYGLTEASRSTFMIFNNENGREESVGKISPNVEIKIENEKQDKSDIGEIYIRGKNVIKKYWKNSEADKNLIDGWLKTGDMGYFDEEGFLFLKGRSDEIINIGGEKVSPFDIEETVKEIPGIDDAAAFGIEHEVFGQTIKLCIVKSKDSKIKKSQILSYCMKNLEKYQIPSKIDFVENIPKTGYGKVKRFMLK